jgi:hypothetical protein
MRFYVLKTDLEVRIELGAVSRSERKMNEKSFVENNSLLTAPTSELKRRGGEDDSDPWRTTDVPRGKREGFALVISLIFAAFLTMIGLSVMVLSTTEVMISHNNALKGEAFYVAEAGLENQIADLNMVSADSDIPTPAELLSISEIPPDFNGFTFTQYGVNRYGNAYLSAITIGPYAGLYALVQPYRMVSSVEGPKNSTVSIERSSEHHLIPIFQFGIFYNQDLEIFPGPEMTVGGRVHANGNLHLGANADLYFNGFVTASGDLIMDRKDGLPGPPGNVWIKDDEGTYKKMTFDSRHAQWEEKAVSTWGGRVQDQAHGILNLGLPLPSGVDPIEIIKRADEGDNPLMQDARFYYKADLIIIDGLAKDGDGLTVTLGDSVLTTHTFYNFREAKWLTATQLDLGEMLLSGDAPENGIIYISASETSSGAKDAVIRLVNGTELPDGGLTIATDNPLYIQGDYNVVDPQPSSVITDAFNILSNAWLDINSDLSIGHRQASNTTVRIAVIAGTMETTSGNYNGGIENFPRFLESWAGQTMTYIGSLVCMWVSDWATGDWEYGGEYYTSPKRDWSFDSGFYNPDLLPPGTPSILNFEPGEWNYN